MQHDPQSDRAGWLKKALAAAKGKPFDAEQALQGRLQGPPAMRPHLAPWLIYCRIDHPDQTKAIAQAEDDLANGCNGLIITASDQAHVLDHLPLHRLALRNEAGELGAEAIRQAVLRQPVDPARLAIDFGLSSAALIPVLTEHGFQGPFLRADGRAGHAGGYSDAEELGTVFADVLSLFRSAPALSDEVLVRAVSVTLAASQNFVATLAKFRAARVLWAEMLEVLGLPFAPLMLHGETSRVMMAAVDAHSNILRVATAAAAAGLGGADSLSVLPFSFNQGVANGFARRVSRNVQLLLLHESELWRVSDPASGAGAIEQRTAALCDAAWAVMQRCEAGDRPQGGSSHGASQPIIGVSKYLNSKEMVAEVESVS